MKISIFQVDAFTSELFCGNPAAVCPLENWTSDKILQSIASENNLSETAFFVRENDGYRIRWFTPTCEVDLCGHATRATVATMARLLYHGVRKVSRGLSSMALSKPSRARS